MGSKVDKADTILVNSLPYTIKGPVTGGWIDPFPEQITIGDADYSNRRDLSSWIMNDLRGGITVEEMDEKVDFNKCYWTNCITQYRNHILPPRLATSIDLPAAYSMAIVNADMELTTGWTNGVRSNVQAHGDTYSWRVGDTTDTYQNLTWGDWLQGRSVTFKCWAYSASATRGEKIGIYDGKTTTYSDTVDAQSTWEHLTVTKTLAADATMLRLILYHADTTWDGYYDDATIDPDLSHTPDNVDVMANFNSNLYVASNDALLKLNATRDGFTRVTGFNGTAIKAIIPSLNSRLYILLGDTSNYWWMSTSEVFTETGADHKDLTADATTDTDTIVDAALSGLSVVAGDYVYNTTRTAGSYVTSYTNATTTIELDTAITSQVSTDTYSVRRGGTWGFQFDAKLFKVTSAGKVFYSTDPDATAPTWTTGSTINDIADQIEGFVVGRDTSGVYAPYGVTNSILKAYDKTTPQWVDTEVRLPNHPVGGRGHAYFSGNIFLSYGLAIREYNPTSTDSVREIGFTERDGLPVEYNGEIVKLYGDLNTGMLIAVDSSLTSGNSKSGLYLYDLSLIHI